MRAARGTAHCMQLPGLLVRAATCRTGAPPHRYCFPSSVLRVRSYQRRTALPLLAFAVAPLAYAREKRNAVY